jgi:arabinose-5-phosphate isomerase
MRQLKVIFEISEKRLVLQQWSMQSSRDYHRWRHKTHVERQRFICDLTAKDIMTKNPKLIPSTAMVVDALNILKRFSITQLVVVDEGVYQNLHLHDILKKEYYNGKKT